MIDFCFLLTTITLTLSKVSTLLPDHYLRNNDFSYYEQIASHTHPSDLQDPVVRSSIKFNHGLSVNQSFKS